MDLSRYLGLFVADARDHLAGIEGDAVRLEAAAADDRRALLDGIFRHLHSLKSSSATMGFEPIARLSHLAEDLVGRLRSDGSAPGAERIDLLLETADELRGLVSSAAEGRPLLARPVLAERLARAGAALAPERAPVPARPAPPAVAQQVPGDATVAVVLVSSRASAPAARAFLALRRLELVATVVATEPTREALREGRLPGHRLTVTLAGAPELAVLRQALERVPDIERVELAGASAPEQAPAAEAPPAASAAPSADQTVRVRAELLDQLLELAGELVLASARLREKSRALPDAQRGPIEEESDRLRLLVKELNNRVLAARQTPVQVLADRLPRAVRDLSRRLAKPLALAVDGADTTLDRGLLEALAEPLLHVLRNAADHGIESPDERARAGKPPAGQLAFSARRERDRVLVELRDDGRGFDPDRLREKAIRANAIGAAEAAALSDEAALRLSFLPGVSTREDASDVSGRGVGMDAVLRAVEQLGGSVELASTPGRGSTVRFVLPATTSVVNLLLLSLGREIFGLPMNRVLFAAEAEVEPRADAGTRAIVLNGERIAAHRLAKLLGLPEESFSGPRPCVIVDAEGQRTAVAVDRLLGQEEVVLRPLGPPLERIRGLAGTAILGSGRPIFVLDVPRLLA